MFSKSQRFYDAVYGSKDYAAEAETLLALIDRHKRRPAATLLDVGCGTGAHLPYLVDHFAVEGLDLDPGMLQIARGRVPGVTFHPGDMASFDLGRRFDVVGSLFSAIAYARTLDRLDKAARCMARHVAPGGLLFVEPFFGPDEWKAGRSVQAVFVDQPELKITRMVIPDRVGNEARLEFHYLVGTTAGIEHFTEPHVVGLFTRDEYLDAFRRQGMEAVFLEGWPSRRGMVIAHATG